MCMYVSENLLLWNYKSKWLVSWNTFWLKSDLSLVPLYWYAAAWEIWGYPYYQSHVSERSEDTLITSHMWVTRHERSEDTPITSHMWVTRHERSEDTPIISHMWATRHERSEDTLITSHMWVTRHERSENTPITSHMWVT
jgi:hypothetical protein